MTTPIARAIISALRFLAIVRAATAFPPGFPESGELREVTLPDWYLRSLFCDGWVDNALLKELSKAQTGGLQRKERISPFTLCCRTENRLSRPVPRTVGYEYRRHPLAV